MAIGTSSGAYYDTDFHHEAGINTDPSVDNNVVTPKETPTDDIVAPPGKVELDKATKPTLTPVADTRLYVSPNKDPDYDMEGWKEANPDVRVSPGQHYPDTYKLPNHITFSDESKYSNDETPGGQWQKDDKGSWTFTPSAYNLLRHGPSELKEYFQNQEPDSKLNLDTAHGIAAEASEKAADALKRAKGTTPTIDEDTGLRGPILHNIQVGDKRYAITADDRDTAISTAMAVSGGGLSATRVPITQAGMMNKAVEGIHYGETKAADHSYEQMASGKFDIYSNTTGKTLKTVDTHEEAKNFDDTDLAIHHIDEALGNSPKPPGIHEHPTYEQQYGLTPGQAADKYHNLPSGENVKFAHHYEEHAAPHEWDKYENLVNDPFRQTPFKDDEVFNEIKSPKFQSYIKMFTDHAVKEAKKVIQEDPSIPFKEALMNEADKFHTSIAGMAAKLKGVLGALPEEVVKPKPTIPEKAVEKGYTEPAYRGLTMHPAVEKDLSPVHGEHPEAGTDMYSTGSPMLADMYAGYLSKHPGYNVKEDQFQHGAQVMPLLINPKDYHYYDAKGAHWTEANNKAIKEAHKADKPGVIVDNVFDEPNGTHSLPPKRVYITFPKGAGTVKSRFAKDFNESSPNILHSIPVIGVGGAAGYISMQNKNE